MNGTIEYWRETSNRGKEGWRPGEQTETGRREKNSETRRRKTKRTAAKNEGAENELVAERKATLRRIHSHLSVRCSLSPSRSHSASLSGEGGLTLPFYREQVVLEIKIFKWVLTFVQLFQSSFGQDRSEKEGEPKQTDHSSNSWRIHSVST